ncbi:MAG: hypothetical protein ABI831_20475 [Betaproteobacteria bacterium]
MVTRRPPDSENQTIGGFLDSIIARRDSDSRMRGPDHLSNRHRISKWLDSLPLTEAMRAKDAAFALLLEQDSLRLPFSTERTEAVFYLDRGLYANLVKLESDYLAAKPGGELEQVLWRACSEIGRAFIVTYERAFTENVERLGSRAALQSLTQIVARIVHYLAWQARLSAYQRTEWDPGRWQQLHRMYRKAKAFGVQHQETPDLSDPARQRRTTVESEYLSMLLMWRLTSGTLSRTEIAQAYYWLRDRSHLLQFAPSVRPGTRLGVDPTQQEGLKPAAHLAPTVDRLLFDSSVLHEPLTLTQSRLEERLQTSSNEIEIRRLRQQLELVGYLITHWVVNAFSERAPRTVLDRRVEVTCGWPAIAAYLKTLSQPALLPAQDGNRGVMRSNAAGPPPDASPARTSDDGTPRGRSLWIIRDESISGCRALSPADKGGATRVGEAVALHDPLSDRYDVALVRRWKMAGENRVEMGVMWLGRNAVPLVLYPAASGATQGDGRPVHVFGGEPEGGKGDLLMALVPLPAFASLEQRWERADPRGKVVLQVDAAVLSGSDWAWVRLRVADNKAGAPGGRDADNGDDDKMTEIEITAPRDH